MHMCNSNKLNQINSETTTFKFNTIKQPQVKRIIKSRSIWLLTTSIIISVICTVIFCAIPPRKL